MSVEKLESHDNQAIVKAPIMVTKELRATCAFPAAVEVAPWIAFADVSVNIDVVKPKRRWCFVFAPVMEGGVAYEILEHRTDSLHVNDVAPAFVPV